MSGRADSGQAPEAPMFTNMLPITCCSSHEPIGRNSNLFTDQAAMPIEYKLWGLGVFLCLLIIAVRITF